MPTSEDLEQFDRYKLLMRQEKINKDKKFKNEDLLSSHFRSILGYRLDKEHILLAKDHNFFHYPILAINFNELDSISHKESNNIVESIYAFIRMLDFSLSTRTDDWGILGSKKMSPANTYVVYYRGSSPKVYEQDDYYGYSFMYNFSHILDVDSQCLFDNLITFSDLIDLYITTCFLDTRIYTSEQTSLIHKWKSGIRLFNRAFEDASCEKLDTCVLLLCAILESLLIKNEGRNKQQRIIKVIENYGFNIGIDLDIITSAVRTVYKYRNEIIHEGRGYEDKFRHTRRIHSYQGLYCGMRPFSYNGAVFPHEDVGCIKIVLKLVIELLIGDKMMDQIKVMLKHN